jgi:hypothetical protein
MNQCAQNVIDDELDQRSHLHHGCDAYPTCILSAGASAWRGLYSDCQRQFKRSEAMHDAIRSLHSDFLVESPSSHYGLN